MGTKQTGPMTAGKDGQHLAGSTHHEGRRTGFGFLSYVSRSGSTLLSRLLNQHPEICVCTEAHLPKELVPLGSYGGLKFKQESDLQGFLERACRYTKLNSWGLDLAGLVCRFSDTDWPIDGNRLLKALLEAYRDKYSPEARVVIYKGPPAMPWDLPDIASAFPDFKLLHLLRDPRAVYASQKRSINPYSRKPFASHPIETAWQWRRALFAVHRISSDGYHEARFEDLVCRPDSVLQSICDYLEVRYDPGFFDSEPESGFSARIPDSEATLHARIDQPPDSERIEVWKSELNSREIRVLEGLLNKLLDEKGYDLDKPVRPGQKLTSRVLLGWLVLRRSTMRYFRAFIRTLRLDRRYIDKLVSIFKRDA